MNIKPILSILPSITEIVGSLFPANNNDYLRYILSSVDDLYFVKQNNRIVASNLSQKYYQVTLSAENGEDGYTYLVPPKKNLDVTEEMVSHACAYSDMVEISCIDAPTGSTDEDNGNIYLSAIGCISKEIEGSIYIGNGISVEWTGGNLIVSSNDPLRLKGISLLNIQGDGYAPQRKYLNIFPEDIVGKGFQSIILHEAANSYQAYECIKLEINVVCICDTSSLDVSESLLCEMVKADNSFLKYGKCLNVK